MATTLNTLVEEWLRLDQNPTTRNEIEQLVSSGNTAELEKRMRTRIEFGTAGLRGKMEAGWSRMNDLIIIQASQGLCAYVLEKVPDATNKGIVIGHDHRHNSERWAKLTAAVFLCNNVKVYLLRGLVHTPLVPFSVKELHAACGVMITASHNPKQDNGYKVYWENAVQIISPHDAGISEAIKANLKPRTWDLEAADKSAVCIDRTDQMKDAYFNTLSKLCDSKSLNSRTPLKFVNTSMHGVSDKFMQRAFDLFGFHPFIPVLEQQIPDPEFPTVKFPNPEEKGALNLAIATAEKEHANYVLAQDPDSDRFSAAERRPSGEWVNFTGDQLGVLFASAVLEKYKASGQPLDKLAMVASAVSSKMVEAMAIKEGFKFSECLTGFKYIGNTGLDLEAQGSHVPFGYEEAIGFMFGTHIRDKDGVAASMMFAELVAALHEKGETAWSHLQHLYETYGYFQTSNSYFICDDPVKTDRIFSKLRDYDGKSSNHPSYPTCIAGLTVNRVVDLTVGYDSANAPSFKPSLPLSSGHMIQFRAESLQDGTRITLNIRTSGTEPKIKYYLEGSGKNAAIVGPLLKRVVDELAGEWMQAKQNGLGQP